MASYGSFAQANDSSNKNRDERTKLILSPFANDNLSRFEISGLRSAIVRVAAKQNEYQLVFKSKKLAVAADYKILILDINPLAAKDDGNKLWGIQALIKNSKDDKLIKRAQVSNIKRPDILRMGELALEVLFGLKGAEALEPKSESRTKKATARAAKATTASQPRETIDFKKRIIGIKQDLPEVIKAEKEALEQKKDEKGAKKKKKNNKSMASTPSAKEKESGYTPPLAEGEAKQNWRLNYLASLSYDIQAMEAMDSRNGFEKLSIATDLNYLTLRAQISARNIKIPSLEYNLSLWMRSPNAPSEKLEAPFERTTNYKAGITARLFDLPAWIFVHAGMRSLQFASLPNQGGGLKASSLRQTFVEYGLTAQFYQREISLSAALRGALSFENESSHAIETSSFDYTGYLIEVQAKNHFYLENSWFYSKFEREEFSNKTDLSAKAQAVSIGFAKSF